jgi:hypothetical protein
MSEHLHWRRKARLALQAYFERRRRPRFFLSLVLIATGLVGLLASIGMFHLGVDRMWLRYPAAVLFGYGALQLSKICNDLRWMSSGPRCGLFEIRLPAMPPGSSIMPGKVNPVVPEVVSQVCYQIIGMDATVSMAAEASELELNMAEPVIAFNLLFGLTLLRNAAIVLNSRCISGIVANRER